MKSNQPKLGKLLRRLRIHKEWTLKQMSERTGIPVSTLSKVEHDHLTLTYDKLQQLSQRLSIRMSELLAEGETVSGAAPQTHDSRADAHARTQRRRTRAPLRRKIHLHHRRPGGDPH